MSEKKPETVLELTRRIKALLEGAIVNVWVEGEVYCAMTNIGVRPSVDGTKRLLETHLFGFRGLLYGLKLRVELYDKIRDEKKFSSVDELRKQIASDAEKIKNNRK